MKLVESRKCLKQYLPLLFLLNDVGKIWWYITVQNITSNIFIDKGSIKVSLLLSKWDISAMCMVGKHKAKNVRLYEECKMEIVYGGELEENRK